MCQTGANPVRSAGFYTDQMAMNRTRDDGSGRWQWRSFLSGVEIARSPSDQAE